MANPERKHTGLRVALATALGFSGAAGVALAGKAILEGTSRQPVSASENQEGGIMPSAKTFNELVTQTPFPITPTVTETPTATSTSTVTSTTEPTASNTPTGTATRESTATPTLTPTKTPEPTKIPTPKPTPLPTNTPKPPTPEPTKAPVIPTEAPKSTEKSPLPRYGAFMGDLINEQTKAKEGVLMVASIPQGDKDSIFVYYVKLPIGGGFRNYNVFLAGAENVQGKAFKIPYPKTGGPWKAQATLDNTGNSLTGGLVVPIGAQSQEWSTVFQLNFTGSGKTAVIDTIKRSKIIGFELKNAKPAQVVIEEIKGRVDFTQWPE